MYVCVYYQLHHHHHILLLLLSDSNVIDGLFCCSVPLVVSSSFFFQARRCTSMEQVTELTTSTGLDTTTPEGGGMSSVLFVRCITIDPSHPVHLFADHCYCTATASATV